jgi:hypothetical protein
MKQKNYEEDNHNHEDYVSPFVLEARRIREEMYREFNNDSHALVEHANREAEKMGILSSRKAPPRPFPPSREWLDFVAMLERQEEEERRREAHGTHAETRATASAGVTAGNRAGI